MTAAPRQTVNRRILVIDDNPAIHADFRKILVATADAGTALDEAEAAIFGAAARTPASGADFLVDAAVSGQAGLALATAARGRGEPYALAFVDMRMPPGWDGLETITRLWSADPELQLVICTAYADYSWQDIVARIGASDRLLIVKKPFDAIEVLQLAHTMCEKWRLARAAARHVDELEAAVAERTRSLSDANLHLVGTLDGMQRAADELRRSEARFRSLLDAARAAILITDQAGRIELWNRGAERLFGLPAADAMGVPVQRLLPDLDGVDLMARSAAMDAAEDEAQTAMTVLAHHASGRRFPVDVSLAGWMSEDGGRICCIIQDASQRHAAEVRVLEARAEAEAGRSAAVEAGHARCAFMGGIADGMREPAASIVSMADLLLGLPMGPQERGFAAEARDAAQRLLDLVDDVRILAQLDSGGIALARGDIDLRELAAHAVAAVAGAARRRGLDVACEVADDAPERIAGDRAHLRLVLLNLLGNAVKFTSSGSVRLRISGAAPLRFEVSDTGIGIPAEVIPRLFQPFPPQDAERCRRAGGTGLGLLITSRLVALMGGTIGCASTPGAGSTFSIELPPTGPILRP